MIKYTLADQLAHVERNLAVVFDGAFAFRMPRQTFRHRLACEYALPPRLGLFWCPLLLVRFASRQSVPCWVRVGQKSPFPLNEPFSTRTFCKSLILPNVGLLSAPPRILVLTEISPNPAISPESAGFCE